MKIFVTPKKSVGPIRNGIPYPYPDLLDAIGPGTGTGLEIRTLLVPVIFVPPQK